MNHDPKGQGASPVLVKPLRRLRAFRVPENYVYDQILGYQLGESKFKIYRVRPGTIPLDAKLVWIQFDPTRHDAYICLEHPSFPEYKPGTLCEEIKIELEEVEVCKDVVGPKWFGESELVPNPKTIISPGNKGLEGVWFASEFSSPPEDYEGQVECTDDVINGQIGTGSGKISIDLGLRRFKYWRYPTPFVPIAPVRGPLPSDGYQRGWRH